MENLIALLGLETWLLVRPCDVRTKSRTRKVEQGSYVFAFRSDQGRNASREIIAALVRSLGVLVFEAIEAFAADATKLSPALVGVLSDAGSPYPFYDILSSAGFRCIPVSSKQIQAGKFDGLGVIILPGGGDKGPPFQSASLGDTGRVKLAQFVRNGGAIWGSCAGSMNLVRLPMRARRKISATYSGLPMVSSNLVDAAFWGEGESGIGLLQIEFDNHDHPLILNVPTQLDITWHLGPLLSPSETTRSSNSELMGRCIARTGKFTPAEYLHAHPKRVHWPGTYVTRGVSSKTYGIALSRNSKGVALACGGHPEFGLDFLLEQWGPPAKILVNFVHTFAANRKARQLSLPRNRSDLHESIATAIQLSTRQILEIRSLVTRLRSLPVKTAWWLYPDVAPSSFGRDARHNWPTVMRRIERSIIKLPKLLRECQRTIRAVRELPVSARGKRSTIIHRISLALQEEVDWLEEFLTGMRFMALDQPDRDYGWETIPTLITNSKTKLWRALFRIEAVEASDPGSTPYMLIWGMYTGAVYDLMNAEILLDRKLDLIRDLISLYSILISKKRANAKSSVQRTLRFQ